MDRVIAHGIDHAWDVNIDILRYMRTLTLASDVEPKVYCTGSDLSRCVLARSSYVGNALLFFMRNSHDYECNEELEVLLVKQCPVTLERLIEIIIIQESKTSQCFSITDRRVNHALTNIWSFERFRDTYSSLDTFDWD
jgi:hypothetical protein